jgi:hypothetical protein
MDYISGTLSVLIYLAGAALAIYILILLVQILRLSVQALKKYLQQP